MERITFMTACRLLVLLGLLSPLGAAPVGFDADIRPILANRCVQCHGGVRRKSDLSFISSGSALAPAKSGKLAISPGHPERSELLRRVTAADPEDRMPPEGEPLTPAQIANLRQWIAEGAAWPSHWSFQPILDPSPPQVNDQAWTRNPIDRFILARLEAAGIAPSPPADRYTLIRRLYFDLLGLPPPLEQVDAFVNNPAPTAYEELVDRLLESPHFGERWARHWLDQARYADSDGYEKDNARPDAWRWRDWVIQAINEDLPFDQFTLQQIAGDLLPEATREQQLATAFHLQTLFNREGGVDPEEDRTKRVIDRVNTSATVWLGLTVGCTQCHSHPYDPITQEEFYRFYAFFNNADESTLEIAREAQQKPEPDPSMSVRVLAQREKDPRLTYVFHRGDFLQPDTSLGTVQPGTPAILPPLATAGEVASRLDLARWLVENPLTPRVRVNKIWATLFGRGFVETLDDFGTRGEAPSHPDLLDWLAHRYQQHWSRKGLLRLVLNSAAYRQSSRHRSELADLDPDNRLVHRQNRLRAEAEIVRDLHLAASGLLEHRIGGPSVYPPIPDDVAALSYADNFKWKTSEGEDRYRRGMYTFFKRTAPDPNLIVFDCPDANVTAATRNRSNTPIQALALLQNEVYLDSARSLSRRVLEHQSDTDRLIHAWRLCLARIPEPNELAPLLGLLEESRLYYAANPDQAAQLTDENPDHAAWISTVRIILNLDEFITRP